MHILTAGFFAKLAHSLRVLISLRTRGFEHFRFWKIVHCSRLRNDFFIHCRALQIFQPVKRTAQTFFQKQWFVCVFVFHNNGRTRIFYVCTDYPLYTVFTACQHEVRRAMRDRRIIFWHKAGSRKTRARRKTECDSGVPLTIPWAVQRFSVLPILSWHLSYRFECLGKSHAGYIQARVQCG